MRGRLTILLALWICTGCTVNESANHGERCGQGVLCAASEICYRGFCTADPQANAGANPVPSTGTLDGGSVSLDQPVSPVDSSGSGPGRPGVGEDAGAGEVVVLDGGESPSTAPLDAGEPMTPATGMSGGPAMVEQAHGADPAAADGSVPVVGPLLPNDGNRGSVCYSDKPCSKDLFCFAPSGGTKQYPGICTDGCRTEANCPAIGGIAQACSSDGQCHNACGGADNKGTGVCPVNEVCRDVGIAFFASAWVCTYADNTGARTVPKYGACATSHGSGDCAEATAVCHAPNGGRSGYCSGACTVATDCVIPAGTTATPVCAASRCEFDCGAAGANNCPDKMNCRDVSNNPLASSYRCVFLD